MFDEETIRFLKDLKTHNDRKWFHANKVRYEAHVREPSKAFVDRLGHLLSLQYGTSVEAKIFRINRDLRFSKDKTSYNTHIHMSFDDREGAAAWMVGLEVDRLILGYGVFAFTKPRLVRWRELVGSSAGGSLLDAFDTMNARLDPPELKRTPAPFAQDHPAADLLRRKGLVVWLDDIQQKNVFGGKAPERLANILAVFDPVRRWFVEELSGANERLD